MSLPRDAMGWAATCDCGISWSYSFALLWSYSFLGHNFLLVDLRDFFSDLVSGLGGGEKKP